MSYYSKICKNISDAIKSDLLFEVRESKNLETKLFLGIRSSINDFLFKLSLSVPNYFHFSPTFSLSFLSLSLSFLVTFKSQVW